MATKPAKKAAPVKKAIGRPSRYKPEFADQARKLCMLGHTDKELAVFFEVSEQTLNTWKKAHPEFLESLKGGKTLADAEVAAKLHHRALGYSHPDDDIRVVNGQIVITPTIKHYPPDTTAGIFWLKNRQRDKWRDKPEADSDDDAPVLPVKVVVQVKDARADDADA
ncbi:terminase [Comamonas aquatica]|uniref:terminase n=1 Tax=Comamonas aquatica TaxID=225991 RepID=UPI00244BA4C7|nr:terminase [Comamonas aquatica]MDH0899672.1 terminase [Comamonas aquatica]